MQQSGYISNGGLGPGILLHRVASVSAKSAVAEESNRVNMTELSAEYVPDARENGNRTMQASASGHGSQSNGESGRRGTRPLDLRTHSGLMDVDKQLAQCFKKAVTINWALIVALLSTTSCRDEQEQHKRRQKFGISCAVSLILNWVSQLLAGLMAQRATSVDGTVDVERVDARDSRRIYVLCIMTYLCNISLTVTAVFLAMLIRRQYVWFFFLFFLHVPCYCYILPKAWDNGISWGVAQYEDYRTDMDFFFGLCFEITQTNFAALSATLFGYMQRGQCTDVHFRAPEIVLLVAIVIGLLLMALFTVPPAADLPGDRKWFITVLMKYATYLLLVLSVLGLGAAVIIMCRWYAFIPGILVLLYYLIVFEITGNGMVVKVVHMMRRLKGAPPSVGEGTSTTSQSIELQSTNLHEEPDRAADEDNLLPSYNVATSTARQRSEPQSTNLQEEVDKAAGEQTLLLINIYSVLSGGLMVTYSLNIGAQYKATVICMYLAISAYLIQVIAVRELSARKTTVLICRVIAALLVVGTIICVIVFFLCQPLHLPSSSTSKPEVNKPPRG